MGFFFRCTKRKNNHQSNGCHDVGQPLPGNDDIDHRPSHNDGFDQHRGVIDCLVLDFVVLGFVVLDFALSVPKH